MRCDNKGRKERKGGVRREHGGLESGEEKSTTDTEQCQTTDSQNTVSMIKTSPYTSQTSRRLIPTC